MTVDLDKLVNLAGAVRAKTRPRPAAQTRKPWRIVNQSSDNTEVYIYDDIGQDWWGEGISSQQFADELDAIETPNITFRFNSQGGHVFEGIAMHAAIARHPANTLGIVDSLAASAASFILMACDRVEMAKASRLMIHDAGVGGFYVEGNAAELRAAKEDLEELATLLDGLSNTIAEIYADKAGGTVAEWRAVMAKDKWYTAEEAVTEGLADGIAGQDNDTSTRSSGGEPGDKASNAFEPIKFLSEMKGLFV